jgi:tetratricopeptide (TPR) repeat protein
MIERLLAADAALARDDLELAQRMFEQVVEADSRNAIAVVGLARVAAQRNLLDEARALAGRALEIDPEEAAARRLLDDLAAAAESEAPAAPRPAWRRWLDRILHRG